jgi:hypothetical protein
MKPEDGRIIASGPAADIRRQSARRTRRSFLVGGATAAAAAAAAYYVDHTPDSGRLQSALRRVLNADAAVARAVFHERGLAPTYAVEQAIPLRLNGSVGIEQVLQPESWRLQLVGTRNPQSSRFYAKDVTAWQYEYGGDVPDSLQAEDVKSAPGNSDKSKTGTDNDTREPAAQQSQPPPAQKQSDLNPTGASDSAAGAALAAQITAMVKQATGKRNQGDAEAGPSYSSLDIGTPGLLLSMDELAGQLPQVELITQFKCVEGWSNITHWAGFRLRDLLDLYPPQQINGRDPRFVYMETPDGDYYGGYDLAVARHPQSLLVTHMHGVPLTQDHGAPLRLHTPLKYGYKQIKRIGLIAYTDLKPDDYWTKLGYDWYAGL